MSYSDLRKGIAIVLALSLLPAGPGFAQGPDDETKKRNAVPENLVNKAVVKGFEKVRTFGDVASPVFAEDLIVSVKEEPEGAFPIGPDGKKEYAVLAISGGGANGAYGAGILSGWTKSGTRPDFKVITGISTGALIAPFVFLGEDYDDEMKAMYTNYSTEDIMSKKVVVNVNGTSSLADNLGLKKIIKENVTQEILAAIAAEHKNGKRLYVATTALDAERLMVWNMGEIALADNKKALELFRDILLASAAIPIVFPPVLFDVVAEGEEYQEMHVDGGTVTQVTAMIGVFKGFKELAAKEGYDGSKIKVSLYIIQNGSFAPRWSRVRSNLPSIAQSSMDTLLKSQAVGDIYRIYSLKGDNVDFNLAHIPNDYVPEAREMFDIEEMKRLFDMGFEAASKGYPWQKKPPMMEEIKGK